MKISGFTICRNSVKLGYPFRESILSLAPLCDEIVIAVGDSEDNTREELEKLSQQIEKDSKCKMKLVDSPWDLASTKGGLELSRQTNIALDHCSYEIVFYLQSDEVLHDEDYPIIRTDLLRLASHSQAQSLVFKWVHFFGDEFSEARSRKWYRREIRAFKKSSGLRSYKDAQGFRKPDAQMQKWEALPGILSEARVLHYGWIRPPELMQLKTNDFQHWWHGKSGNYQANSLFRPQYGIRSYKGTHPQVMKNYINELPKLPQAFYLNAKAPLNWDSLRCLISEWSEFAADFRPGEFKNYSKLY